MEGKQPTIHRHPKWSSASYTFNPWLKSTCVNCFPKVFCHIQSILWLRRMCSELQEAVDNLLEVISDEFFQNNGQILFHTSHCIGNQVCVRFGTAGRCGTGSSFIYMELNASSPASLAEFENVLNEQLLFWKKLGSFQAAKAIQKGRRTPAKTSCSSHVAGRVWNGWRIEDGDDIARIVYPSLGRRPSPFHGCRSDQEPPCFCKWTCVVSELWIYSDFKSKIVDWSRVVRLVNGSDTSKPRWVSCI